MTTTCRSEKDVKRYVKALLDKHKFYWWMPPANGYGQGGISDFNAIRAGVFLVVETKFGANKPTPLQIGYLNSITAEGGFGFVVNERTLADFKTWLEAFDRAAEAVAREQEVDPTDGSLMLNAIAAMTVLLRC